MDNCKYNKNEIVDGFNHEFCSNEELKELNKSHEKNFPCMGSRCGRFEEKDDKHKEEK